MKDKRATDLSLDRRTVLGASGALAAVATTGAGARAAAQSSPSPRRATPDLSGAPQLGPVVDTANGKVRGYIAGGIHTFRGLRYGAPTGGANRFKPPVKPDPWTGVMESYIAKGGNVSPQATPTFRQPNRWSTELDEDGPPMSEDCLFLNLFTPGVNDGMKRPVMVFLHGGAWGAGGGAADLFDGTRLARRGDTVIVSPNFRLNSFGFLYLAEALGPDYADSGNCGTLDIVAALRWVKENIASFGGDPGNVTLFGWSAGGSGVLQVQAMPAAEGLIHKAICQSGAFLTLRTAEAAARTTETTLGRLGLTRANARQILSMSTADIIKGAGGGGPVFDRRSVPRQMWENDAPPMAAKIPMLVGGTDSELSMSAQDDVFALDEAGLLARLRRFLGDPAPQVIAAFRENHPGATPGQLMIFIITALWTARRGIQITERKVRQGGAPVYSYLWTWRSPVLGGKYLTAHGTDLPFVWDNVAKGAHRVASGPGHQALADRMSNRWLAFARTGNPNAEGLVRWAPYDLTRRATLVIDRQDRMVDDPRKSERLVMETLPQSASDGAIGAFRA